MGYRNIGPEDGWSDPCYVDDWGNVVPLERVVEERKREALKEEVKKEIKRELEYEALKNTPRPGIGVHYESEELRKQCEEEMSKVKVEPPVEPPKTSEVEFPYWQGINLIVQTYLQSNGLVAVKKEKYDQLCRENYDMHMELGRIEERNR